MIGKIETIALFLIIIAPACFACAPGYEEKAVIQVVDNSIRPIPNASVQITYQVDVTTSKGYATTSPKLTDALGMVNFTFRNQEIIEEKVDCAYVINVKYDNKDVNQTVNVDAHGPVITVQVDAYRLNIIAVDQAKSPLAGAVLAVRNIKAIADSGGMATLILGSGDANVTLRYGHGILSREIEIKGDTDYRYEAGIYDLNLYAFDDNNQPLALDVALGSERYKTDANGFLSVKNLFNARPEIKTLYGTVEKTTYADLELQPDWYVIYDVHAPKISDLSAQMDGDMVILNFRAEDAGVRASGLAPGGLKIKYMSEGNEYYGEPELRAQNTYMVALQSVKNDGVVQFEIETKDHEGNIRVLKGYFTVTHEKPGETQNDGGVAEPGGFQIEPIHIIAGGVVVVAVLAAIFYIRKKDEGQQKSL